MINKNELIFAVDENNQPIEPVERHMAHKHGIWHRTTDIAVINSKQEILCHKRSMLKDHGPGLWDAVFGGHTLAGVEPVMGAIEELREESGLSVEPSDLEFVATVRHISWTQSNKEFRYGYIYRWNGKAEDIQFEKDEIDAVKWVSLETVKANRENIKEWSPMPYLDGLLKKL